jgi:hypothetical protein
MPEPFSIVSSVFGLTTGSISLLLAIVEKSVSTSQKAAQCKHRLRQVELHVGHLNRKLSAWVRKWAPNSEAFPESTYVFIWGDNRWALLQARVDAICREIRQLEKILLTGEASDGGGDLDLCRSLESDTWRIAVTRAKGDVTKLAEHEVSIGKKIAFAIWEGTLSAEGLDRLKKLVDDIDADSRLLAADVVWKLGKHLPESYRTNMAHFFDTRTKPLWQELDQCHATLSSKLDTCAILFRPPKSQDFWNIQDQRSLTVEFVCTRGTSATQDKGHWISTDFDFHDRLRSCLAVQLQPVIEHLSNDYEDCENCDRAILDMTLKQILRTLSSMPSKDHWAFCKERDVERLQTALAVATWAMYAWPTAWIKTICSCGIRNAVLPGGLRFPVLEDVAHHDQGCLIEEACHTNTSRYLLLGVLLAEIALARPIRVIEDDNDASRLLFELHDPRVMNRDLIRHLRKDELLHLMDKRPLLAFQKAVQYCFEAWLAELAEPSFRVEHLGAFVENILDP